MRILLGKFSGERAAIRIGEKIGHLAVSLYRNPILPLVAILLIFLIALTAASRLKLDTDLAGLLPRSFESVRDLEDLKGRYGGEGYLVVVGLDADPEGLRRFAADIAPALAALPGVRYVEDRRPTEFFRERALYFLTIEDLETVRERLDKRKTWEVLHNSPFYVDLLDTKAPPLDFSDIQEKYKKSGGIGKLLGGSASPYYLDEQQRLIAVLVKPSGLASDFTFAQSIVHSVETVIAGMDLRSYGPTMRVELTGRYKKRVDMQAQIRHDIGLGSLVALLLMFLYVIFRFRGTTAVLFIFAPLALGLAVTFGFAGLVFVELNILTAFIGTILMGTGIDHGIHLLSNYEAESAEGRSDSEAVFRTFSVIGRAVLAAALTMVIGFAALSLSQFKAFYQFGVLASVGSVLLLVAYLVFLPVLLGLARRTGWKPRTVKSAGASAYSRFVAGSPRTILAACVLFSLVVFSGIPKASFNYDFASLEDSKLPSYRLDGIVNKVLGYSQTPLAITVPEGADAARYAAAVRKRIEAYGAGNSVDFILSDADLVPPDQEAKQKVLLDIANIIRLVRTEKLEPEQSKFVEQAKTMVKAPPFSRADLPEEVARKFRGVTGSEGYRFILVFPSIKLARGDLVLNLAREVRDIPVGDGVFIRAAGEPMILADMLNMVYREAAPILATVLALVFAGMWLLLGSFWLAALCLLPSALTILAAIGIWSLLGFQINYINMIMIPLLLGIGVSGGLHMIVRLRAWRDVPFTLTRIGPPITGSMLTIIFGFGAMVLAHHPGLASLGKLAALGLTINLFACLLGMAALMTILCRSPQEGATVALRRGPVAWDWCCGGVGALNSLDAFTRTEAEANARTPLEALRAGMPARAPAPLSPYFGEQSGEAKPVEPPPRVMQGPRTPRPCKLE
ncbi:MAG: MMPL family transporter [Syntrophobacteraceae bacterium]